MGDELPKYLSLLTIRIYAHEMQSDIANGDTASKRLPHRFNHHIDSTTSMLTAEAAV